MADFWTAVVCSTSVPWIVGLTTVAYVLYWYGTSTFDYFVSQGIPGPKPMPYVGNLWGIWKVNIPKFDRELIKKHGKSFGWFDGTLPNLWTTDLDLIKAIFVKDFEHFVNRRDFEIKGKYFRKMVTDIKDQEWKKVRSSVTPAFTTGKIKQMSDLIKGCAEQLAARIQKIAEGEGKLDAKPLFSAFTMEVIACCAFGMNMKNLDNEDNLFMKKAKEAFAPAIFKSPFVILPFLSPALMKLLSERFFASGFDYFINVLVDVLQERAKSDERYNDFIALATESVSEVTEEVDGVKKTLWTKEEVEEIVIAQSALFWLAGFDTTATTLANAAFLLAKNQEVQEKLYHDIRDGLETHGEVNHDMVADFPYVDHVLKETLRMYPAVVRVERQCNKDITINGIRIQKGMIITVPAFALHYDEDYYPDPETFNPDRWDSDSPTKPNAAAYMPFGFGPRNCIGMRFALEEMKIALCTIVNRFRFFPVAETPEQMEFADGFQFFIQPVNSTLGIESRV